MDSSAHLYVCVQGKMSLGVGWAAQAAQLLGARARKASAAMSGAGAAAVGSMFRKLRRTWGYGGHESLVAGGVGLPQPELVGG